MKKNILLLLITGLLFTGCMSAPKSYTLQAKDGIAFFIRQTDFSNKKDTVKFIAFDITTILNENKPVGNPLIKYTLSVLPEDLNTGLECRISFRNETGTLNFSEPSLLYKQLDYNQKYVDIRSCAEIPIDELKSFLQSSSTTYLVLTYQDGTEKTYTSRDFSDKITEMRITLL